MEQRRELREAAAVPEQRDDAGGIEFGSVHDPIGGVSGGGEAAEEEIQVAGHDTGHVIEAGWASE